ncbi:MAG: hypothetical protein HFJ47_02430 [Clostridia bacterium]|nr:hypothetical protein [Clostridia bacterium]
MKEFFGIKFDTENTSQEEFDALLKESQSLYVYLVTQSRLRKMAEHKNISSDVQSSPY